MLGRLLAICGFFFATCTFALENSLTFEIVHGPKIASYLDKLIDLRIAFYNKFPYLYEPDMVTEKAYVNLYVLSDHAVFVIAKQDQEVVGIIAGLPVCDTQNECNQLFIQNSMIAPSLFYLGDAVLAEGIPREVLEALYMKFENAVIQQKQFQKIYLCEIARDSLTPNALEFWQNLGFVKQPKLYTNYAWKDIGSMTETDHTMMFLEKELL
jgi:hypothetical protein